jgi:Tfp pilus assembly protein PilF
MFGRFVWLVLILTAAASADVLVLDDGTTVEGKAHKDGDQWIVTDSAGHETAVAADRVKSFELVGARKAEEPPLDSLRRSVEHLSDLDEIIRRYKEFVEHHPDVDQANADLAVWQKRRDDQCVKIGSRWLTPAERDELSATETLKAQQIGDMISQDRLQDAADALKQALTDDPQDPTALYLNGLILATQNQNVPARAALEQSNQLAPAHAATLNNLAVILWRQRLYAAAINNYVGAMTASPLDKTILDNVAEALHALPADTRDSPLGKKAVALFVDQDTRLQEIEKTHGLYRWGSAWVPANQLDKLQAEFATLQSRLAEIHADYDRTQDSIDSDQRQLDANQRIVNAYQPQPQTLGNVTYTQGPYPPDYVQLSQDIPILQATLQVAMHHKEELEEREKRLQHSLSVPQFTGEQRLIGPEGTPIRSNAPTTRPNAN